MATLKWEVDVMAIDQYNGAPVPAGGVMEVTEDFIAEHPAWTPSKGWRPLDDAALAMSETVWAEAIRRVALTPEEKAREDRVRAMTVEQQRTRARAAELRPHAAPAAQPEKKAGRISDQKV